MPLNRNAPRDGMPQTYDAMMIVGPTGFMDRDIDDYIPIEELV